MVKLNSLSNRFRIVFRRSPILLKCAVLITIVLSIGALTILRIGITQTREQTYALRVQAAHLEQENEKLDALYTERDSVEGTKAIAREYLDLVDKDAVIYDIVTNQN